MTERITRLRIRGDLATAWTTVNPILLSRELAIETDTHRMKVGDGTTAWAALPYLYGTATSYVHTQAAPSSTWTIAHNLGFKPSVELLNTGSQEIEGDVVHVSYNVCMAYFTTPTAGFARLN